MSTTDNRSTNIGEKALKGEWEEVTRFKFEITEDMKMAFCGASCNIFDAEGNVVESISAKDGQVEKDVHAGYCCYIMRARVKFDKGI